MILTKNQINARLAAILTTLAETGGGPESSIYLALGMDMGLWSMLKGFLLQNGLMTCEGHWCELTGKGASLAEQCNAALAQR